jgi:hypothetical protein
VNNVKSDHLNVDQLARTYLSQAENLFGPMVSSWKYRGIEFHDHPPHLVYYPETAEVAISLSEKTLNDDIQLRFQLSHEICHILYPAMDIRSLKLDKTNVLNEGISTFFSIVIFDDSEVVLSIVQNLQGHNANYYNAFILVKSLLSTNIRAIRDLRNIEPFINRLNPEHFSKAGIEIANSLKNKLLQRFK